MKSNVTQLLVELDNVIGVWSAHETFSMGPDVTLEKVREIRGDLEKRISNVSRLSEQFDKELELRNECAEMARQIVTRTRKAVGGIFGPDSTQYAQVGGTRRSERKKPIRKTKTVELAKAA